MAKYESNRRPEITAGDLPNVTALLNVFDSITFNQDAEIIGLLTVTFPVIGEVVISFYDRENHFRIGRKDGDAMWSGYTHELGHAPFDGLPTRAELINKIKAKVRERVIAGLAD